MNQPTARGLGSTMSGGLTAIFVLVLLKVIVIKVAA